MNASEVVHALDHLTGEQLRSMTPAELSRFRELCHHWLQLAEVEAARRNEGKA